jgi:CCR4-NOT transcription complex subunit 4
MKRMAQHKHNLAQQAKKKAAAKQKEAQKREADHLSRKHLAGLRVRQKNLVYVTGLKPKTTGEKLVEGLRGKDYFGQYGDIVKIVVSKSKDSAHSPNQPVAIYITYVRKEDAAACIESVDGFKQQDGSKLR